MHISKPNAPTGVRGSPRLARRMRIIVGNLQTGATYNSCSGMYKPFPEIDLNVPPSKVLPQCAGR